MDPIARDKQNNSEVVIFLPHLRYLSPSLGRSFLVRSHLHHVPFFLFFFRSHKFIPLAISSTWKVYIDLPAPTRSSARKAALIIIALLDSHSFFSHWTIDTAKPLEVKIVWKLQREGRVDEEELV